MSKFSEIFCCQWQWLVCILTTIRYVTLCPCVRQVTALVQKWRYGPQNFKNMQFRKINAPQGRKPCAIITKFSGFVGSA